jgi:hypothetical protein
MSSKNTILCLSLSLFIAACSGAAAAEIHVSPAGNDANPGTKAKPFATIERARDAARKLPQRGKEPVRVILRGGVYRLAETLVLTAADSGATNAQVEYRAAEGEAVVLSGGSEINWR